MSIANDLEKHTEHTTGILARVWKQLAYCLVYVRANRQTLSKAVAINENEIVNILETDKQPRSYIIQF